MSSMLVPILLALSDISVMAISATSADFDVSFARELSRLAEKLVVSSIYSFALIPAVLYAFAAFCFTLSALSLNSVSIPPRLCSRFAPSITALDSAFPIPAAAITPLILLASPFPYFSPGSLPDGILSFNIFFSAFFIPFAVGRI